VPDAGTPQPRALFPSPAGAGDGPLAALSGAVVGYRRRALFSDVTVGVSRGDFLAIVGPNGAGKTTLLRTLLGVQPLLSGRRTQAVELAVGYVPQRDQVDPIWPLSAQEVALMGRARKVRPGRRTTPADLAVVAEALRRVGVGELAGRPYRDLSGGQRQRTLIARALAAEPQLLALDEPTSGMDPAGELDVMELLEDLNRERGLAVVMVSHRLEAVANFATQLAFVDHTRPLLRVGKLDEMLTGDALSALYGRRVEVRREGRQALVVPGRGGEP
jgi:ABC-type Mn2+/Zn2+ transport system ATPase subunit